MDLNAIGHPKFESFASLLIEILRSQPALAAAWVESETCHCRKAKGD